MPSPLPPELWQPILDHLHDDTTALCTTSLICRAWLHITRHHLFSTITLTPKRLLRSVQLNSLLASPHTTIPTAVRSLKLPGALVLGTVPRGTHTASAGLITGYTPLDLRSVAPRLADLQNVREISLTDVPTTLLATLPNLERLNLSNVASTSISRALRLLPRLRHLELENVSFTPIVFSAAQDPGPAAFPTAVETVVIRRSNLKLLPQQLAIWSSNVAVLAIDRIYARELPYLEQYLVAISSTLRELHLCITGGDIDATKFPVLLESCKSLQLLYLRFTTPADVRRFFAGATVLVHRAADMQLVVAIERVGSDAQSAIGLEDLIKTWGVEFRIEIGLSSLLMR
ncbi:hypothetical protein R3P38DRAFT_374993 [Favolaschia claudopus]|uniref:F-box domain-containing protein n=1 Tax=Favolaschia claudopus TaxID=2862362 RepID=A0AAV9ZHY1_9AGAR